MADETEKTTEQPKENIEETTKKKSGLLGLIKGVALVLVLVVAEVVAASMLIPSGQETEKLAQEYVAAMVGKSELTSEDAFPNAATRREEEEVREMELGTYNITRFNPANNTTLSIDFDLFGIVLAEEETEFMGRFEKNKNRIREQVIMTLHNAGTADLSDAGLGLIKRRILEKINRSLGLPLVREVLFSKFNYLER